MIEESVQSVLEAMASASPLLLAGGAYYKKLPDSVSYPVAVHELINENKDEALDNSAYTETDTLVQIRIYGDGMASADTVKTIARSLQSNYNGFVGTFGSHTVTNMVVTLVNEDYEEEYDKFVAIVEIRLYQ